MRDIDKEKTTKETEKLIISFNKAIRKFSTNSTLDPREIMTAILAAIQYTTERSFALASNMMEEEGFLFLINCFKDRLNTIKYKESH